MILKYFELNKLNFNVVSFLLFHGKNEGYKNEEIEKITKRLKRTIVNYDEKQIKDEIDSFYESILSGSLFEKNKISKLNQNSL